MTTAKNAASLGSVDLGTVEKVEVQITDAEKARQERMALIPPLEEILNLHDFEVRFTCIVSEGSWVSPLTVLVPGYCENGDARKGVGVLLLCRRRRDHYQREPRRVSQVLHRYTRDSEPL